MKNSFLQITFILLLSFTIQYSHAQFAYADHITGGTTYVLVEHSVADFDTWFVAYKQDDERRQKAGITERLLLQGTEDANAISVVLEIDDVNRAKGFFADPKTQELMQNAGVTSEPDVTYFNVKSSNIPDQGSFLIIRHAVENYDSWKAAFDKHETVRAEYDLSLTALGTDIDDPLNVVAIFNAKDAGSIRSFLEESDLKIAMESAGIASEPVMSIAQLHEQ